MSRLTIKLADEPAYIPNDEDWTIADEFGATCLIGNVVDKLAQYENICDNIEELQLKLNRLKQYEDKLADGRLVELPCKVGGKAFWYDENLDGNPHIGDFEIKGILIKKDGFYLMDKDGTIEKIGTQYALLTKAEAEQKLKEVTSNGN